MRLLDQKASKILKNIYDEFDFNIMKRLRYTADNSESVAALLMGLHEERSIQVRLKKPTYQRMVSHKTVTRVDCLVVGDTKEALPISIADEVVFESLLDNTGHPYVAVVKGITVEPQKYASFAHRFAVKLDFE